MLNPKAFDEMAQKLYQALPDGVKTIESDLKKTFKDVLSGCFDKLDLVTREEFNTQVKVLAKTREKVDALEKLMSKIEK